MSIPSWACTYPRLYDLYLESELGHPDNYFEHKNVSDVLLRQPHEPHCVELEQVLTLIDLHDWNDFKKKTKRFVTVKDDWGWHTQIFERFHEARGYAFLKQHGYSEVHFIPEKQNQKTPDLWGKGNQGIALLEAKRIRDSDKENDDLIMSMEPKNLHMQEVVHSLPDPLKEKINSTVQRAQSQLHGYNSVDRCRQILFLSIRLDLWCATKETKLQIEQHLSQLGTEIEIVHQIENDFFL